MLKDNESNLPVMIFALILLVILAALGYWLWFQNTKVLTPKQSASDSKILEFISPKGEIVKISSPQNFNKTSSPLIIDGQIRGTWSFEASFPVILQDANGKVLAQTFATLTDDWMTTDYVPFKVTVEFTQPATETGVLILKKDNPSDNRELDDSINIPVIFK